MHIVDHLEYRTKRFRFDLVSHRQELNKINVFLKSIILGGWKANQEYGYSQEYHKILIKISKIIFILILFNLK